MSMPNFLTKFLIDKWFKLTAAVSAAILVLSLFYPTQGVENKYVACISLGVFLFSIVEWSQYEPRTVFQNMGFGGIRQWKWREKAWSIWDVILKIIAILLIVLPLLKLIFGIELIPFPE